MRTRDLDGLADDTLGLACLGYVHRLIQCQNEKEEDDLRLAWPCFSALWDERRPDREARTDKR